MSKGLIAYGKIRVEQLKIGKNKYFIKKKSKKKEREKGLDPYLRGCPEACESSELTEKSEHLESDTGGPSYEELLDQLNSIFVEISLNDDHPAADADDE